MVKLLYKASSLKDDDCRLKSQTMQCPENAQIRKLLIDEIEEIAPKIEPQAFLSILIG